MNADNKTLAIAFLRRLEQNDVDGALGLADDNLTYWLSGPGTMNKKQFKEFFGPVGKMIRSMKFNFTGSTVEGDRVALEAEGRGELTNGRIYENKYHFLFEVRNCKIAAVKEYADSAPAMAAFFSP